MPRLTPSGTTFLPNTSMRRAQPCWRAGLSHWHDDKDAPRVAVVNRRVCAARSSAPRQAQWADISRCGMERASKWWALWKTENTTSLTEDPQPAMFLPILQSPSSETWLVVRSNRDPQQLAAAIESTLREPGSRAARLHRNLEPRNWTELCLLRAWRRCRWVCWA